MTDELSLTERLNIIFDMEPAKRSARRDTEEIVREVSSWATDDLSNSSIESIDED